MLTIAHILSRLMVLSSNPVMDKVDNIVHNRITQAQELNDFLYGAKRDSVEYTRVMPEFKDKGRQTIEDILGTLRTNGIDVRLVKQDLAEKFSNQLSATNPNDNGALYVLQQLVDYFNK